MADTPDLKSEAPKEREGSTPSSRTKDMKNKLVIGVSGETHITEIWNRETGVKIGLIFESDDPITASDEYHTMDELYEHRYALFVALCNALDALTPLGSNYRVWKSKKHSDDSMHEGSFIAGIDKKTITGVSHITYHLPLKYWDNFKGIELPNAPKWDGHTSEDVLERVRQL